MLHHGFAVVTGDQDLGGRMTPSRLSLAPVRRGLGAALVVFLLVCAVVYYREAASITTSASTIDRTPGTDPSAAAGPGTSPSASAPGVDDDTRSPSPPSSPSAEKTIEIQGQQVAVARPFQAVPIRGVYHGGTETLLRVQRREGTKWLTFPIPTMTDEKGRFSTHVELEQPGPSWVRVLDPETNVVSEEIVLEIKG
jgi:hypothetical protein